VRFYKLAIRKLISFKSDIKRLHLVKTFKANILTIPNKIKNHVITFIVEHINSLPAESSHFSRKNRKYLSPTLNIHKSFLLYNEKCNENTKPQCYKVKKETFSSIFCTLFLVLEIHKVKRVANVTG